MPNWVTTWVTVIGPKQAVLDFFEKAKETDAEGNKSGFTFNAFVPMPPELNIPSSSHGDWGMEIFHSDTDKGVLVARYGKGHFKPTNYDALMLWADLLSPEIRDLGAKYASNLEKHGVTTWYDWSVNKWGTKWDACHVGEPTFENGASSDELIATFGFDTAWSPAEPVFEAMTWQHPELEIRATFDEESHEFYYQATWKGGEMIEREDLEREEEEEYAEDENAPLEIADLLQGM